MLSAFAADNFDAQTTVQSMTPSPVEMVRPTLQRGTGQLSHLLPILRPDQRGALASKIEHFSLRSDHEGHD